MEGVRARRSHPVRLVLVAVLIAGLTLAAEPADALNARTALGVYAGPGNASGAREFGVELGRQPTYAMDFLNETSWQTITDPAWALYQWANSGYRMVWGIPILPESGASLMVGATGRYDPYFRTIAQDFVAAGQGSSIIRLGWEFNGYWVPWAAAGHARAFVAYWRQIVNTMRAVPGANFEFLWNPTRGDTASGRLSNFYPGNSFVSIIGLDVYDTEWDHYPGAAAEFRTVKTEPDGLNWLVQFGAAHKKPIALPEWGLGWGPSAPKSGPIRVADTQVSGGDDPIYINDMARWIASHHGIEATFWDYSPSPVGNGKNPKALAMLTADFGS